MRQERAQAAIGQDEIGIEEYLPTVGHLLAEIGKAPVQHIADRHAVLVRHGDQVIETDKAHVAEALGLGDGRMRGDPGEKALLGQYHHLTRHVGSDVGQIARRKQCRQVEREHQLEVLLAPRMSNDPRRAGSGQSHLGTGPRASQRIRHPQQGACVPGGGIASAHLKTPKRGQFLTGPIGAGKDLHCEDKYSGRRNTIVHTVCNNVRQITVPIHPENSATKLISNSDEPFIRLIAVRK